MLCAASHGFEAAQVPQGHRVDAPVSALRTVGGKECASGGCRVDSRGRGARFKLPDGGEGTSCATGALASALARVFAGFNGVQCRLLGKVLTQIASVQKSPVFLGVPHVRTTPAAASRFLAITLTNILAVSGARAAPKIRRFEPIVA